MSYIKINGSDVHYNVSISPFTTQQGLTSNGFEFKFNTPSSSESQYWGTYHWVAMK